MLYNFIFVWNESLGTIVAEINKIRHYQPVNLTLNGCNHYLRNNTFIEKCE